MAQDPITEYPPSRSVPRCDRANTRHVDAGVARTETGRWLFPERRGGAVGRRRLRSVLPVRRALRHADARPHRRTRWLALFELPHHGALHADPRLPDDRQQSPLARVVRDHRDVARISRRTTASSASSTGSSPRCCSEHGYNTFAVGKWHLTAPTESTTAGPFNRWPLGRGFERFYGFLAGSTDHWYPDLVYDNHPHPGARQARGRLSPQHRPRRPRYPVREGCPRPRAPTSRS